VLIEDLTRR